MADKIRISPNELNTQASKLSNAAESVINLRKNFYTIMGTFREALSENMVADMDKKGIAVLKKLDKIYNNLNQASSVAKRAAESFQNTDVVLRNEIDGYQDKYKDSPVSAQRVEYTAEEINTMRAAEMEIKYQNQQRIDTSTMDRTLYYTDSNGNVIGYYEVGNGCTWYAASRYRQVNGNNDLKFASHGGNADNWINSIDNNLFDVNTSSINTVKFNSIAVSTEPDEYLGRSIGEHASGNHVAYIEAVKDGFVYYSDGSYGKPESAYGYIKKLDIETFCKDYEYIISKKNS